jgi:hypothetical protein
MIDFSRYGFLDKLARLGPWRPVKPEDMPLYHIELQRPAPPPLSPNLIALVELQHAARASRAPAPQEFTVVNQTKKRAHHA